MKFYNKTKKTTLVIEPPANIWYQKGSFHRLNGPAYIEPDGYREWLQNGRLHRIDGPAVIYADDYSEYFENNKFIDN